MSKNNKDTEQEQEQEQEQLQEQEQSQEQPHEEEPVLNGSAVEPEVDTYPKILSAPTREELAELIDNLTAPEGASLIAGCVARDTVTGAYIIQIDIL